MPEYRFPAALVAAATLALTAPVSASADNHGQAEQAPPPDPMADVEIEVQEVGDGLYMLTGRGGNIGLSAGDDATFIIDDQYAPLTDRIVAAIGSVTERPVDYVLNTHWHFDHTGGNENFGTRGALIMAHDNVRKRMKAGQVIEAFGRSVDPAPAVALPVVTFNDRLTLHANGHTIRGLHVPAAHTDGDTMVFFEEANVLHMGDVFFHKLYPFIDLSSGGNLSGVIAAAEMALGMIDEGTRIIPGHGPLATKADLLAYRNALVGIRDAVAALVAEGKSLEEVQAARPTAPYDATANEYGFLTPDQFVGFVYGSLVADGETASP
jgi:glyoxylase-like metal-dependent hydrolase (beta-lactamase superfamily II)